MTEQSAAGRAAARRPGGRATRRPVSSVRWLGIRTPADHLVVKPIDLSTRRVEARSRRPLDGELLREVPDLAMSRARNQWAELRGEPAPATFHPGAGRDRSGGVAGSAA